MIKEVTADPDLMRQLEVQLIIRPPVNVLILARASSGEGRVHDREIHVRGGHRWMRSRAILLCDLQLSAL
jgi:hypothetical protein